MNKKIISIIIFLLNSAKLIVSEGIDNNSPERVKLEGIFIIDTVDHRHSLAVNDNKLIFSLKKEKKKLFRIIQVNSNSYCIETKEFNKRLGINIKNKIILLDKNSSAELEEIYWNIIQIKDNEFLIQNNKTKNFLEFYKGFSNPRCLDNLTDLMEDNNLLINKISDSFKFSLLKLYEEVELKPENIEFIEKEPIDVLIKYIDLRDENLNREGIKHTYKDEDNEELKYNVRSILQNIPWIRKIFILMPNEKVKYFKPIEEISDKFVYVKDKDLIGFDSGNSRVFQYYLGNMTKFGLSENFILMDDDYFFGKPINKTQFFYYDEEQKKVLPSIVTDDFSELNENDILKEYKRLDRRRRTIKLQSFFGWKLAQLTSFKLLLEQFKPPLINNYIFHINETKEYY